MGPEGQVLQGLGLPRDLHASSCVLCMPQDFLMKLNDGAHSTSLALSWPLDPSVLTPWCIKYEVTTTHFSAFNLRTLKKCELAITDSRTLPLLQRKGSLVFKPMFTTRPSRALQRSQCEGPRVPWHLNSELIATAPG